MTPSEILLADDKDLNEYVGLKKLAPYRKERENWDARRVERLREFKKKVSSRLGAAGADVVASERLVDGERQAKKRKGRKERMREKATRAPEETADVVEEVETKATDSPRQSKEHAKLRRNGEEDEYQGAITTSEPVKKKRRRQKKTERHIEQAVV